MACLFEGADFAQVWQYEQIVHFDGAVALTILDLRLEPSACLQDDSMG